MRPTALRVQRVLVSVGFLLVGVSGLLLLGFQSRSPNDQYFYWIVTAIGYGVLAWACWAWLAALSKRPDGASGTLRALRLVALACLLLGIAYLGLIHELIQLHRYHVGGIRDLGLSDLLSLLGFCMASLGFWTTASASGAQASVDTREVEPTAL